jgi:hypothetical protein
VIVRKLSRYSLETFAPYPDRNGENSKRVVALAATATVKSIECGQKGSSEPEKNSLIFLYLSAAGSRAIKPPLSLPCHAVSYCLKRRANVVIASGIGSRTYNTAPRSVVA